MPHPPPTPQSTSQNEKSRQRAKSQPPELVTADDTDLFAPVNEISASLSGKGQSVGTQHHRLHSLTTALTAESRASRGLSVLSAVSSAGSLMLTDTDMSIWSSQEYAAATFKFRQGAVLARHTILKRDHFPRGMNNGNSNASLEFRLDGAPNFRCADLNVFGVSQPTVTGLNTVLTLLQSGPCSAAGSDQKGSVFWFNTREEPIIYISGNPYVLRDASSPKQNIRTYAGISFERLEQMESRLKDDIIKESYKCRGLITVHDELDDGRIVPSLITTAVDGSEVMTTREVFASFIQQGYKVKYKRIPISPEQRPEDRYLEEYLEIVKNVGLQEALVFNCGMGVGRTTFGMVAALLIRRAQMIKENLQDPFAIDNGGAGSQEQMGILRLVYVLERGLNSKMSPHSAVEWVLARSSILDRLKTGIMGNYNLVMSLASVLENGLGVKQLLDDVINRCDALVNLREEILMNRVRHSVNGEEKFLEKALGFLERYFFLLAFASYVQEGITRVGGDETSVSFSTWMKARPEIWNMLQSLRKKGPQLFLFRPVEDLSAFSNIIRGASETTNSRELDTVAIKNRSGAVLTHQTILKLDNWHAETTSRSGIEGAPNFRHIHGTRLFAVAQPTYSGMSNVITSIRASGLDTRENLPTVWINLREEPLIYINGSPYVLRDEYYTLRNIRSYSGITQARLELLESRLKEDVLKELGTYDGKILLHEEGSGNIVSPVWSSVHPNNVMTLREMVAQVALKMNVGVEYHRVPITAETSPEEKDFDQLLQIISKFGSQCSFVLNCQIGQGRSTTGTVIALLVTKWLNGDQNSRVTMSAPVPLLHYQIINSLMRVIRNGLECKRIVDEAIDACAQQVNIRESVEDLRLKAESSTPNSEEQIRSVKRGIQALRRYFLLIAYQSYLSESQVESWDQMETFVAWFERHQEFASMLDELHQGGEHSLLPVDPLQPGDGVALTSEVVKVVNNRAGSVLAPLTILKFDHFPGCQKLSLTERVEGAPNFRRVSLSTLFTELSLSASFESDDQTGFVYGVAMPTKEAIKVILKKVKAGPEGIKTLLWTSLREEPVLYLNGKPYVLRVFQNPVKNIETTGIVRERVEMMESRMKQDALNELRQYGGRILLHEEEAGKSGGFEVVPVWETIKEEDVETPFEVYESIMKEGYKVEYLRIPITDEQAPLPNVFDLMMSQVYKMRANVDILFNCQMGRGRTTTGMVVACLMRLILTADAQELSMSPINDVSDSIDNIDQDENERKRYMRGEYKLVLQLIRVLPHGKLSKMYADRAIDTCGHIQDIRGAIYDFKLRSESHEAGSKKLEGTLEAGLNYLIRYFFLVTFADYLLEYQDAQLKESFPSFSSWLADRREITNIIHKSNQDLS